jgi:hypothetical protein
VSFAQAITNQQRLKMRKTVEEIEATKIEMSKAKLRSRRRIELELRLRDLVLKQLRSECRKRKAA